MTLIQFFYEIKISENLITLETLLFSISEGLIKPLKSCHLGNCHLGSCHLGNCHLGSCHLGNCHLGKYLWWMWSEPHGSDDLNWKIKQIILKFISCHRGCWGQTI